jgi:presenilin-like A22 family membrane protease
MYDVYTPDNACYICVYIAKHMIELAKKKDW